MGRAAGWNPVQQVSSDERSRKCWMCLWAASRETEGNCKIVRPWPEDKTDVQLVSTGPWTGSVQATCVQQGLKHNVVHYLWGWNFCINRKAFFDLQHAERAIRHQVDFKSFKENTGIPCWWRGFWVTEGFVKLLQRLVQGPYRHLPSLWQTQWDCTDPGGSNGY